ncbi:MAG TPA: hypothetical protein VF048_01910 [Gemmatimonadaceae bacterium]
MQQPEIPERGLERPDPTLPTPGRDPSPEPTPAPTPPPQPWHDPGPPVREVDLPPDQPTRGVPVENPERPPAP